jgi:hypothetical protein
MLRIPNVGDYVRMLIPTVSDNPEGIEITTPAGAVFLVEGRRIIAGKQGLQFRLGSVDYAVLIFIDETDLVDSSYPLEFCYDDSTSALS